MTEDQTPNTGGPEDVERHGYAALVDSLTGILDLYGGLAEAVDVAAYTAMRSHIANLLNLEAGLQAALGAHHGTEQSIELGAAPSIAELLLRAGAGNPAAKDELVRRYSGVVLATVRSFRLQDADASHAVQMTWLRLAENAHQVRSAERLAGWLTTTARRECLRILRRATVAAHLSQLEPEIVADPAPGPEQRVINADTTRMLGTIVAELSPRRGALLRELFADHPQPYAEVARAAGIPIGGVGPTRARALRQLRDRLDGGGLGLDAWR